MTAPGGTRLICGGMLVWDLGMDDFSIWRALPSLQLRWLARRPLAIVLLAVTVLAAQIADADAQRRPPLDRRGAQQGTGALPSPQAEDPPFVAGRETVQADVSTRSVAVTSSFSGTEVVIFGAVNQSRQSSAESGYYDIIVVVEGTPTQLVARKKARVWPLWLNANSITFESVPSYYAIVSTRPIDEVADPIVLRDNDIGFDYVRMTPVRGYESGITTADLEDFKAAVIGIKQQEHLYFESQTGVAFIGPSLFRASLNLPANVPVGPLQTRVYLFHDGRMLHSFQSRVTLRREGFERELYAFAFGYPLIYGLVTVALSLVGGLAATELFRRSMSRA